METPNVKTGDKAMILHSRYGSRTILRGEVIHTTPKQAVVRATNGTETRWWLDSRRAVGASNGGAWASRGRLITEHDEDFPALEEDLDYQRRKQAMIVALREAEKAPEDWGVVTAALDALSAWHHYLDGKLTEREAGA